MRRARTGAALLAAALLLACAGPALAAAADTPDADAAAAGGGPDDARGAPAPWLLLGGFLLLILIPFVPGLLEVQVPRDEYPLPIKMDYLKDPRYLGTSARRLLREALGPRADRPGRHRVVLSKGEIVKIQWTGDLADDTATEDILLVDDDLQTGERCSFARDLHVRGAAGIGPHNRLRALAADGDVRLGGGTRLTRWLDAEGDLTAEAGCDLGQHAAAGGAARLRDGVVFRRVFGAPVTTDGWTPGRPDASMPAPPAARPSGGPLRTIADAVLYRETDADLAAGSDTAGPLVTRGDLRLGDGAVLRGSARAHGAITVGPGAMVEGDLFAEGPVLLEAGARVRGSIFTQDRIELRPGARVGRPGAVKSVVGKKEILLGRDVAVHGYLLTEGRGEVSCGASS